ncbi:hypothetical protein I7I48_07133 [Histoplasma ohiense]|nr:hypothetical protein I7I48_07133 [Histoplasma ohiense (nom. inval.)]
MATLGREARLALEHLWRLVCYMGKSTPSCMILSPFSGFYSGYVFTTKGLGGEGKLGVLRSGTTWAQKSLLDQRRG